MSGFVVCSIWEDRKNIVVVWEVRTLKDEECLKKKPFPLKWKVGLFCYQQELLQNFNKCKYDLRNIIVATILPAWMQDSFEWILVKLISTKITLFAVYTQKFFTISFLVIFLFPLPLLMHGNSITVKLIFLWHHTSIVYMLYSPISKETLE